MVNRSALYSADMIEALRTFMEGHETLFAWLAWGSAVMLVISLLTLPVIALLLPADFLVRAAADPAPLPPEDWRRRHPVLRWTLRVLKNVAGALLAFAGLAMLVLPGQGLLTLALALVLLDIPGKRRLERYLLRSPRLLSLLNKIRQRFGRPTLHAPET